MIEEEEEIFTSHSWKVRSSRFYFISSLFDWSYTKKRNTQSHNIDPFASKHKARTYLGLGASNFGNILTWQFNLNFKVKEVEKNAKEECWKKVLLQLWRSQKKVFIGKISSKIHRGREKWSDFKCFLGKSVSKTEIASMKIEFGTSLEKWFLCFLFTKSPKSVKSIVYYQKLLNLTPKAVFASSWKEILHENTFVLVKSTPF